MALRVLVVCTGNICRSPLAAMLLRDRLGGAASVTSAGTGALVGAPMPEPALALAARLGARGGSAHRGVQIAHADVQDAHLVLGLAREHRSAVVQLEPAATRRTFTLRELALIARTLDPDEVRSTIAASADRLGAMRDVVALAAARRSSALDGVGGEHLDVVDPYRRSAETYERAGRETRAAIAPVVDLLLGAALPVAA